MAHHHDHLPGLRALSLGPPTGPMAQYGKQILEAPSQETGGKRRKGNRGLAVDVFRWVPEEGDNPICPITQEPFVPGQWVYKTPPNPPANPTNYDPYALDQFWAHQTPVMGFLKDIYRNPIPIAEWNDPINGLAAWVQAHPKPESPAASPFDAAQYVHKPPKNDDGTDFVQREQPPPNDLDGLIFAETPAPPPPPRVRYPGAGRLYGVPAYMIAESDAPEVVKRYAAARVGGDLWPLRYFNPTVGEGCKITHTASVVVMTVHIGPNTPLFRRFNRLHGPVAHNPDIRVPGSAIHSLHIEDVFLRELCCNTDGDYPPGAFERIYNDEDEWTDIRKLFRSRDFKLDPFRWDFSGLTITLRVSTALLWDLRAPTIADLGRTRLNAIYEPWRNADGKIGFGEPGEYYRTFPADPPELVRSVEVAFREMSAKLISTIYNVISVVMHGDVADWPLNGKTWRETETFLPPGTARPERAPWAGFWVPRYEHGAEWGGIPADMVAGTSEYVTTEYHPGPAVAESWASGYRTCSFPIWYAVDARARGWLPSLGSDDFADRRTEEGVRAPVVWQAAEWLAPQRRDFTPSGTPEMTLQSEGVPVWLAGFVKTIATYSPWMDWRYFAPFAGAVSLEHDERGLMHGLPPGTHQEVRGISRIAFTILGTSAVGKAISETNAFEPVGYDGLGTILAGGLSFRDFLLYTTFRMELQRTVLEEMGNVARERPTLFGRAVHSSDFNVIVERLEGDWKVTIEMSDALDSMAWSIDPSWSSFPSAHPRTAGGYNMYERVYTPLHDRGVSTLTMPARRDRSGAECLASGNLDKIVRRAYSRLIMGTTEAVSAILALPNRGERRSPRLWSSVRMPEDVAQGGFLAAFPAEKWYERNGYTNSVLQRESIAHEVMAANPPTNDGGAGGRADKGSFFFWYATAPVDEPAHYNVQNGR